MTKSENKQKIEDDGAGIDLYCSAIVSQLSKRQKSTKDQSCLKAEAYKLKRTQNLRSSSSVSSYFFFTFFF